MEWAHGHDVRFAVLCDNNPAKHSTFSLRYRVVGSHSNSRGGSNTLNWTLQGINWLTRRTPLEWLIVVSGTAVPLRPLEEFIELLEGQMSTLDPRRMYQDYELEELKRGVSRRAVLLVKNSHFLSQFPHSGNSGELMRQ